MKLIGTIVFALSILAPQALQAGMVLAFDDGYHNWTEVIAPELAEAGGKATAYVNNTRLDGNSITIEELRELRSRYGWEIATHTYHHHNATQFVAREGLDTWLREELQNSLAGLRELGFEPSSLAFPFNSFDDSLRRAALRHVDNVRRREALPLAGSRRPDGTIPAAAIDLSAHVPTALLRQWIDTAAERGEHIFLFGHKVLPDSEFGEFTVKSVSTYALTAERPIDMRVERGYGHDTCLVPDTERRMDNSLKVVRIEGDTLQAGRGDLHHHTSEGKRFLVGPCYGTPLSGFRSLIEYATERMPFLTVSEALEE
ncbi:MAG TPA: polysaccharide deacetylase family protein [Arenicellales bacterium]|nr:polysaccharide deacetylase family protein [Arenicellales bacterium]